MMGLGDCYGGEGIIIRVLLVGVGLWRGGLCNMHCTVRGPGRKEGLGLKTFFRVIPVVLSTLEVRIRARFNS